MQEQQYPFDEIIVNFNDAVENINDRNDNNAADNCLVRGLKFIWTMKDSPYIWLPVSLLQYNPTYAASLLNSYGSAYCSKMMMHLAEKSIYYVPSLEPIVNGVVFIKNSPYVQLPISFLQNGPTYTFSLLYSYSSEIMNYMEPVLNTITQKVQEVFCSETHAGTNRHEFFYHSDSDNILDLEEIIDEDNQGNVRSNPTTSKLKTL